MGEIHIKVQFRAEARVWKDEGEFVSHCPALDVHSQGETEQEALENLFEATQLFVLSCFERGTLNQVLKESGFELSQTEDMREGDHMVNIPIQLIAHAETQTA